MNPDSLEPVVSIIVVNWKVRDMLRRCLASIYAYTRGVTFELLVVDNDSRDGSVEMVAKEFPRATIFANNRNLGFAAGNNPAIAQARGEFVLLLNPDTELIDDAVTGMVTWMRAHPEAGIVGPCLADAASPLVGTGVNGGAGALQSSVMRFPTLASQVLIMLKVHNFAPNLGPLRRYFAVDFDYSRAASVDQVKGAAFMIRRSVLERIGLLDERFFIWYEEVDYCKRAIDAGFQVWYAPVATVVHHGGASFGQWFGPSRQRMLNRSMRWYMRKHLGMTSYLVLLALHPLSMLLAYVASPLRNKRYAQHR